MIHVLLADDEPAVLGALADLIAGERGMKVVAAVEDARQAVDAASRAHPDVALLDVRMPGGGADAVRAIARTSPETKVLALSAERDRTTVLEMLEAGSVGYLTKGCAVETIVESIVRAASGEASLSTDVAGAVIDEAVERSGAAHAERDRRARKRARIERALGPRGFAVVLQPVIELQTGETVGVEALSRFPRGTPDRWFADANEVDLGLELELAAVERAFAAFPAVPQRGFLAVNLSPAAAATTRFRKLASTVAGSRLVVEITEHARIANYERLGTALDRLRGGGVRIAIDDAGAGFASLRHILRLAPDLIKLDRSLVSAIEADRSKQALAGGLTSFAEGIGATIVAEGIERQEELDVLERLGIGFGQGFFLARPYAPF